MTKRSWHGLVDWLSSARHLNSTREGQRNLLGGLARVAVPDEHEHLPDEAVPAPEGPLPVAPDYHVQAQGDTIKG